MTKKAALLSIVLAFKASLVFGANCKKMFFDADGLPTIPFPTISEGPKGERTRTNDSPSLIQENQAAELLTLFGFRVRQNPSNDPKAEIQAEFVRSQEVEGLNLKKSPDFLINQNIFDHYAPELGVPAKIVNGILKKVQFHQTRRVLVDLTANVEFLRESFTLNHLAYSLHRKNMEGVWEVMVLHGTAQAPRLTTIFPEMIEHPLLVD